MRLEQGVAQLYKTKNGRARVVALSAEAVALVAKQKYRRGHVFITRNGTPYGRITEMWIEVMNRTELIWVEGRQRGAQQGAQSKAQQTGQAFIRFRFHDLRHMFAINYLRNGGNLCRLQQQLGHSTIRQTEEYLAYLTPEEQSAAKG